MRKQENGAIEDNALSTEAFDIMCYLLSYINATVLMATILSKEEEITIDIEFICKAKIINKKKRNEILKELLDKGYLSREKEVYSIDPILLSKGV